MINSEGESSPCLAAVSQYWLWVINYLQLILVLDDSFSSVQWRYCIRLENLDSEVVQLRERHWRIFSLSGTLETVRGRGVVGRVGIVQLD